DRALLAWEAEQIEAFPHQEKKIRTVVAAMGDFFESDHVINHKMQVSEKPVNP
ncbi:MAG: hypothetical protein JKX76_13390, partial [Colwellia sp.]|nr:hypothetical protein [Colwellia sp.]